MPLYGFFDTRLRGNPVEVQGLRHGTTPCSSRLTIFSVTIAYTSICFAPVSEPASALAAGRALFSFPHNFFPLGPLKTELEVRAQISRCASGAGGRTCQSAAAR